MEARGVTNLLLAVIAGVLLFGKDAMVSGIQGIAIVGIVIAVLFGVLMFASYLIGEVSQAYRETKNWTEVGLVTMGFVFMAAIIPLMGYVGLLWLDGVENPMRAAMDSELGTVWKYVLFGGFGIMALVVASNKIQWLYVHRANIPNYANQAIRWLGAIAIAPVLYPVREWRWRTQEGSGIAVRIFSSAYAVVFGLGAWVAVLMGGLIIAVIANEILGWI
ncbi:hypothetical protein HNQ96_003825 [Aminobacter lissarensis]|uniref:Uncharacterized protein n=1 Tax=Aminobacter carboxidus TaxID=376165 RepID=A0A8E1WG98_9HYPH|nr:hypothetical protein [Aminobacter lissarensis]MBB6467942.1 hypothetical protein [Aminobacter lissarensis]